MVMKQCPFCGNKNIIFDGCRGLEMCNEFEDCHENEMKSVVCSVNKGGCGASSGFYFTEEQAIEKWNIRDGKK